MSALKTLSSLIPSFSFNYTHVIQKMQNVQRDLVQWILNAQLSKQTMQSQVEIPKEYLHRAVLDLQSNGDLRWMALDRFGFKEYRIFKDETCLDQHLSKMEYFDIWEVEDKRGNTPKTIYKYYAWEGWNTYDNLALLYEEISSGTEHGIFQIYDCDNHTSTYVQKENGWLTRSFKHINRKEAKGKLIEKESKQVTLKKVFGIGTALLASSTSIYGIGNSFAKARTSMESTYENAPILQIDARWLPEFNVPIQALNLLSATFAVYGISAITGQERHIVPGVLIAGMMFLSELVKGQSLCPQGVGNYDTPGGARDVVISGNYAYVADRHMGLQIFDVSNVANPTLAGFYDTPGLAYVVVLSGNYAYVADHTGGLQIIDVNNVTNPSLAGFYNTIGVALGVAVSGNYAYVAERSGLLIIDVTNVANPSLAGSFNTTGFPHDVALSGSYVYLADASSGLLIIDVSNIANPTLVGSYNTPPDWILGVVVSGNYAYIVDFDEGSLQIVDVSNVVNPTLAGSYNTPGRAYGVVVSGNYTYVADGSSGLQIIDVSNAANPTLAGFYDTPDEAINVAVSGNYAYVADGSSGLQIISIPCFTSSSSTSISSSTTSTRTSSRTTTSSSSSSSSSSTLSSTIAKSHSLSSLPLTTVSSPNNSSIIWIGLGIGVVLCLGLAGGIVYIIQKHKEETDVEEQALGPITNVSFYNPSEKHETLEEENPYGFSGDVKEKSDRDSQYQRTPDRVKAEDDQHYQHTPVRESPGVEF
ncbi:MAG: hypothetical protein K940chlam7_00787 [Chlamydiae bacterium]|nr:hypothetical protein [Chlamydiota bacterium]